MRYSDTHFSTIFHKKDMLDRGRVLAIQLASRSQRLRDGKPIVRFREAGIDHSGKVVLLNNWAKLHSQSSVGNSSRGSSLHEFDGNDSRKWRRSMEIGCTKLATFCNQFCILKTRKISAEAPSCERRTGSVLWRLNSRWCKAMKHGYKYTCM